MPLKLNYKTREVSTADFYDTFEPPLIFRVRGRAVSGWQDVCQRFNESEWVDPALAQGVLLALCVAVGDGSEWFPLTTEAHVKEFCDALNESELTDEADLLICAFALGVLRDYLREKKAESTDSAKPSPPLNGNGRLAKEPAGAS